MPSAPFGAMDSRDATLKDAAQRLADILRELESLRILLGGYEGSVTAVTLRPELSRLQRQLELLSETVTIVVHHLPTTSKSKQA